MKKILFLLLILTSAGLFAQETEMNATGPWMVCEVAVSGLKNVAKKTVTKAVHAKKGVMYERGFVYDDMQAIISLGSFDNAEVDISPMEGERKNKEDKEFHPCFKVTYIVKEKPIFDAITYEGRKRLSRTAITEAMTLKIKDPFNETKLVSDLERIKAKYAEKGYINADIKYETEVNEKLNIVTVKFIIDEGQRARVKEVGIEGANLIPSRKLVKKTANRPGKVFKPQKLQQDYVKMTLYGRNKGFSEYEITPPQIDMNDEKSEITINYDVTEGAKAQYGTAAFDGNTVFTDEELQKQIFFREGKTYTQKSFDMTMRDLQEQYANKGYLNAKINPIRTIDDAGRLNILFDISESHIFYIDHVDVTGYETTRRNVLAREITVKPGDLFDYSKIRRSQTRLLNLGFINDVQLDISPTAYPDRVDVGFNVVEGRPGMFTAGVAMSSLDGLYGEVSVSHMNLFGRAQRLNLRTQFGKNLLDYTIGWSTPWVFDRPVSFGVDAFNTRRYRPFRSESRAYTDRRIGGRVRVGPRFSDDIYQLAFSYTFQNIDIYDIDDQFKGDIDSERLNSSSFSADFAIDTRDNIWDPTTGWRNSIGLELTGGPLMGDLDLWTINLRSIFNRTLINIGGNYPIVFVLSNKFASTNAYGRTGEVPVFERFFIGGADTIRGYDHNGQVGPQDGGNMYFVSSAEVRLPLAREGRRSIAQLAAFFDIGNSWKSASDVRFRMGPEEDEFKAGVGLGLRFATPQLPIRIDWGYGLNHRPGESRTKFYFNMSNAF
ncbi:Outer membrane protein assembly complex, YaeT protein [Elusimicrobium minutum Pei191]|uniref:Outer membrane protein assembly factor BamA n=1 Tax=Elusimicrobium minutum (strain Pei191) TaxID=445932 RepID=B2KAU4_ELUMP|nr:outer membrane protein assembly factor BamA [Elusimicrobium minutum]ACC97640.1 Outer membrane protein assembly complex, YaeT protein [Elusimicrobium minutum Pei191]